MNFVHSSMECPRAQQSRSGNVQQRRDRARASGIAHKNCTHHCGARLRASPQGLVAFPDNALQRTMIQRKGCRAVLEQHGEGTVKGAIAVQPTDARANRDGNEARAKGTRKAGMREWQDGTKRWMARRGTEH